MGNQLGYYKIDPSYPTIRDSKHFKVSRSPSFSKTFKSPKNISIRKNSKDIQKRNAKDDPQLSPGLNSLSEHDCSRDLAIVTSSFSFLESQLEDNTATGFSEGVKENEKTDQQKASFEERFHARKNKIFSEINEKNYNVCDMMFDTPVLFVSRNKKDWELGRMLNQQDQRNKIQRNNFNKMKNEEELSTKSKLYAKNSSVNSSKKKCRLCMLKKMNKGREYRAKSLDETREYLFKRLFPFHTDKTHINWICLSLSGAYSISISEQNSPTKARTKTQPNKDTTKRISKSFDDMFHLNFTNFSSQNTLYKLSELSLIKEQSQKNSMFFSLDNKSLPQNYNEDFFLLPNSLSLSKERIEERNKEEQGGEGREDEEESFYSTSSRVFHLDDGRNEESVKIINAEFQSMPSLHVAPPHLKTAIKQTPSSFIRCGQCKKNTRRMHYSFSDLTCCRFLDIKSGFNSSSYQHLSPERVSKQTLYHSFSVQHNTVGPQIGFIPCLINKKQRYRVRSDINQGIVLINEIVDEPINTDKANNCNGFSDWSKDLLMGPLAFSTKLKGDSFLRSKCYKTSLSMNCSRRLIKIKMCCILYKILKINLQAIV